MAHEEMILQIQQIEQQAMQIEQYLETLDQQISSLQQLQLGLSDVQEAKGKETFSALGAGIYLKTELKAGNVLTHVGENIFVEKTFDESKAFLESKITEVNELKNKLLEELEQLQAAMQNIAIEIQRKNNQSSEEKHEHAHTHKHEDDNTHHHKDNEED